MKPVSEKSETPPSRSSALAVGAATLLASGLFRQGLGLVTLIVTARLLTPEDFGIIAYFLIATKFVEMLQRQVVISLIRLETVTDEHLSTVFTLQLILGVVTGSLIWLSMPLASWIGLPELAQLQTTLAVFAVFTAFRSTRFLIFERELKFGPAAIVETILRVTYSVAVVFLAWYLRDFWAVVIATFAGQIIASLWTFKLAPMLPKLSLKRWRDCVTFSTWAMSAQIAQFVSKNLPQIIIGSALGLADAGLFRLGNRITNLVTTQLFAPMLRVLYPGLADASRKENRQSEVFAKMNTALLTTILPISIGMALLAEDVIVLTMGEKWLPAAMVIWILAPLRAVELLQANVRAAIYVDGSTRPLFFRSIALLAVTAVVMWVGVKFNFSGAVISAGICSVAALAMTLHLAKKFAPGGFFGPLLAGWRSFVGSAAMAIAIFGVGILSENHYSGGSLTIVIGAKIVTGAVAYTVVLLILWIFAGRPDGLERFLLKAPGHLKQRLRAWKTT